MANSKTTKKALFTSMMSLLLCFTMLMGTTFAWFTDSVKSANNIIKTGNLDMKLSYKPYGAENTVWTEVDESTVLFGKDALYEPGYTEAVWLKVENLGSLAFRYDLAINVASEKQGTNKAGEKFSLSDYLEVKYMTTTSADMESNYYTTRESLDSFNFGGAANSGVASLSDDIAVIKNGVVFSKDDATNGEYSSAYVLVVISMPTTVTNKANHNGTDIPEINFSLTAVATQLAYEKDSFGPDYDEGASVEDAIFEHGGVYEMTADRYENVYIAENADVIINGNDYSIIKDGAVGFENYGNATLNNVKMDAGSVGDYSNICRAGSETVYNEVDIYSKGGGIGVTGGGKVIFNSGSLEIDTKSTSGRYLFYAVETGSQIVINGGNFDFNKTQNQKRAYIYAGVGATVYVNGGTFGKASTRSGYTAGILGEGTVIITGGTFGFDPTKWVPAEGYSITKENGSWTVTVK